MNVGVVQVKDTIISHGCFLRECKVENSIVGIRSRIESGCDIKVYSLTFYLFLLGVGFSVNYFQNRMCNYLLSIVLIKLYTLK